MYRRKSVWVLAVALIALIMISLVPMGWFAKSAVATYNGGSISKEEFERQFAFQRLLIVPGYQATGEAKREFLEQYIVLNKVIAGAAAQDGITLDEAEVKEAVAEYRQQLVDLVYQGDESKLTEALAKLGLTEKDIETYVRQSTLLSKYRESRVASITITDEEVKQFFDEHKANFMHGTVSHLLVKTEAEAKQAKERLEMEPFDAVAKSVSTDPTVQMNGGRLENVEFSMFEPEFFNAATTIDIGKVSEPVHTAYGYEILRVEKRTEPTFDEVKDKVKTEALAMKQNLAWDEVFAATRDAAGIEYHLE